MLNTETFKRQIKELVDKYNNIAGEGRTLNEEATKNDFILKLFCIIGWNVDDSSEVSKEEKIYKKRVDYGFRINGIPKFFLEAKSLNENLDDFRIEHGEKITYVQKAIDYAYHKGCAWAVLTNFKEIRVYNAETKDAQNRLFLLKCENFFSDEGFEQLMLLSRESFEKGVIDKLAEKWDKKMRKIPINERLLSDFTRFRDLLSKNIMSFDKNRKLIEKEEDLDEAVQRILDRLIFIRNCEDREMEEKMLWEAKNEENILKKLRETFLYFDKNYNSKLFTYDAADNKKIHLCDILEISNEILREVIEGLYYTRDRLTRYNFSAIEADVLGNIYEQYLGHILRKSDKRAKLTESHAHRKKQGIYYTPTYIVDYIIRNTVCELLKDKKTNYEKIRILDPACGSGSFLIKAFDLLYKRCKDKNGEYTQTRFDNNGNLYTEKTEILKNNIFGVDLDRQAVEIAQLNLLLKIAEKGHRLPLLQQNIKCGNSLIDDENISDRAFKWESEFKHIMDEGGFDAVVGNPPYIAYYSRQKKDLSEKERIYYKNNYEFIDNKEKTGSFNTIMFFIEQGLGILKENGYLGFIIDIGIFENAYKDLRKYILNNSKILKIITGLEEFEEVGSGQIILILQSCKDTEKLKRNKIQYQKGISGKAIRISQELWMKDTDRKFEYIEENNSSILEKCEKNSVELSRYFEVICGLEFGALRDLFIGNKKYNGKYHPVINGSRGLPDKYRIVWNKEDYVLFDKGYEQKLNRENKNVSETGKNVIFASGNEERFNQQKLFVRQSAMSLIGAYDDSNLYGLRSLHTITKKEKNAPIDLKYLLSIINSGLATFYSLKKGIIRYQKGKQPQIRTSDLEKLPIKNIPLSEQQAFIKLADKAISLNKKLNEIQANTDARSRIEEEIKKTDAEIDELVYKLYGITEEEKKIIEDSLK
ncbi:MAG: N-6 DNA methylase [Nanoarchaeota archaeon]|nr:N-6 DNA methylase [Nanoarchaeota archaeon]